MSPIHMSIQEAYWKYMGFRQEEKCGKSFLYSPFRHVMWFIFSPECVTISLHKVKKCMMQAYVFVLEGMLWIKTVFWIPSTVTGEWMWVVYLSDWLFIIHPSSSLLAVVLNRFEHVCFHMSCVSCLVMLFISMSVVIVFCFSHVIQSSVCIHTAMWC